MNRNFQKISVLGGGLLGGSIALALGSEKRVALWFRKPEAVKSARELGLAHATGDLAEAVAGTELLILAVPVGAMPDLLEKAIDAGLPADCLITDVGSVKQTPHRSLAPILEKSGNPFIGSHPMAGSEQNGLSAARAGLFNNAACLLTNDSAASSELCAALEAFWKLLGCRTSWLGAAEHDTLVARISHLPHVTAAATAKISLKDPAMGQFGGGGLRDTTRVASGNPVMWAEILTENRDAIIPALHETIAELREILASLESPDQELVHRWLSGAKELRDTLP
ncbi:MAG: prephenate dehydrogenase/arogenate dehydrogenase family protein [Akkermansiaceae bacterium]|nr:prephenate dehydrogenase/arogenate dehydrogenase family protein [Akkermansiaceae bacterium]MDP4647599.1 prephenate dehydrogenase/arogenate dehydrogenase family protein [Akkermansiaceae bacterium]MDP4847214.1 prephenate dehydrogenase/arogenate dehydrogenase family protein [Akkermansiaceae bacterium]MDP4995906.1 prephenate dehydrogenase/arogenate dehydrogenase family protein [Akkermansiaceae bacterium]